MMEKWTKEPRNHYHYLDNGAVVMPVLSRRMDAVVYKDKEKRSTARNPIESRKIATQKQASAASVIGDAKHQESSLLSFCILVSEMLLVILITLAELVSSNKVFQSPLIWEESKTVELIEKAQYAEYLRNLSSLRIAAGAAVNTKVHESGDFEYAQKITIGRPEQEFVAWVTTFTSLLWVPHYSCSAKACEGKSKFVPENSTTFANSSTSWKILYSSGYASGILGSDVVRIGGTNEAQLVILKHTFGIATKITDRTFQEAEFDGVLGLAFFPNKGSNSRPFIASLIDQGVLDEPIFTVWLGPRKRSKAFAGTITYGGVDSVHCGPILGYAPLSSDTSYEYKFSGVMMGEYEVREDFDVIQDMTMFIWGPSSIVNNMAKIAGAQFNTSNTVFDIACSANFPELKIYIGGNTFTITSDKLIIEIGDGHCIFAMVPKEDSPSYALSWYFGAPFLRQFCVVFNLRNKSLSFANVIPDGPQSTIEPHERTSIASTSAHSRQLTTPYSAGSAVESCLIATAVVIFAMM
ncbi:hypothetical protein RB195_002439 [Necator americanus]